MRSIFRMPSDDMAGAAKAAYKAHSVIIQPTSGCTSFAMSYENLKLKL